jgi:HAD superfamily hydrolase (TIGR01490 family)
MPYAFFDLDHTLLPFDTQALFCNYVLRRQRWRLLGHLAFLPIALARVFCLADTARTKQAFLSYLNGMTREELGRLARGFAEDCVSSWIYPELRAELERHRSAGRILVLNTASPDFYAHEIARVLGFQHCFATRFALTEVVPFQPDLIGPNNKREAKIIAMQALIPELQNWDESARRDSWAYSDSAADIPLLEFAEQRVLIHPSSRLRQHFHHVPGATRTLLPRRPYRGKLGDMLAVVRQMFGLYPERPST